MSERFLIKVPMDVGGPTVAQIAAGKLATGETRPAAII